MAEKERAKSGSEIQQKAAESERKNEVAKKKGGDGAKPKHVASRTRPRLKGGLGAGLLVGLHVDSCIRSFS